MRYRMSTIAMKASVYITNQMLKPMLPMLDPQWDIITSWDPVPDTSTVTALATTVWDGIDAAYLAQFPLLKTICHLGIGTDNIDTAYLARHQIALLAQPQAGIHDTAELALTLMLTLARKIIPNDAYTRANQWAEKKPRALGTHLLGKQLGLVGLGQIGSTIAGFAAALGMHIAYATRNKLAVPYTHFSDINALARHSDFLIVCCSGGTGTKHLISQNVLDELGSDGYLINVSRGSVVDQNALIDALQQERIAGAALDVYDEEPHVPQALRTLDNVVLSPHMGSSTKENLAAMYQLQAQQLNDFLHHT